MLFDEFAGRKRMCVRVMGERKPLCRLFFQYPNVIYQFSDYFWEVISCYLRTIIQDIWRGESSLSQALIIVIRYFPSNVICGIMGALI